MDKPDYHFQVMIPKSDDNFRTLFKKGILPAAEDFHSYVEFIDVTEYNSDSLKSAVDMAILAGVDGIALKAFDTIQTQKIIDEAKKSGMAVVTYESTNYSISNTTMVGSNNYAIGTMSGEMAARASGGYAKTTVILGSDNYSGSEINKNLIIQGMTEAFSKYGGINVSSIHTVNPDRFDVEKVTLAALQPGDKPNLIICLDERSTPIIAQVLVDTNHVRNIHLIGYGNMPQTLEYIRRGVIYGTICSDAYDIGYYTIQELKKSLENNSSNDFISTELFTIDKDNVEKYMQNLKE